MRCLTVWVKTKRAYRKSEATAANASCEVVKAPPGAEVVKRGSTIVMLASVITVASAEPVPEALKLASRCRAAPTSRERPTMPLRQIITAAKTVSRA